MSNTRLRLISGAALIAAWALIVVMFRAAPVEPPPDPVTVDAPTSTTLTTSVPIVRVAASGRYADEVLSPLTIRFMSSHDIVDPPGVDVDALATESDVWRLTESGSPGFDVVEVGFRLDAISGPANDRFISIDRSLVPNLEAVSGRFASDVNGIIPGVDGAVMMFADTTSSFALLDWPDLVEAARSGIAVVVPGPPLSMSVVFVWALGLGDPDVGLQRYEEIVAAGGVPVTTTANLRAVLETGPTVGAWSSSGIITVSESPDAHVALVTPTSGLVPLPAFSGILATSSDPVSAHKWLNFRLDVETQDVMTFRPLILTRDGSPPVPWGPVVDSGREPTSLVGFDPLRSPTLELDWAEVAATADDITSALTGIVEQ